MVLCRYVSGDPVAADDISAAAWVPFAEVETAARPMSRDVDTILARARAFSSRAAPRRNSGTCPTSP